MAASPSLSRQNWPTCARPRWSRACCASPYFVVSSLSSFALEECIHCGASPELTLFFDKEFSWAADEIQMSHAEKRTQIQRTKHLISIFRTGQYSCAAREYL